jgi:hypothetical protein
MGARSPALALLLLAAAGCGGDVPRERTVIASESLPAEAKGAAPFEPPTGTVALPWRSPAREGSAWRLVLESSGERSAHVASEPEDSPPFEESQLLELEYTELPAGDTQANAWLARLDALHYRLRQRGPDVQREIELGADRLRIVSDGKVTLDLRGAQPSGDLTPRKLLGQPFLLVAHDARGDPTSLQQLGVPPARRFLKELPVREAMAFSRLPLPGDAVAPGARWGAARFPPNAIGTAGLRLEVDYELAGFAECEGRRCALVAIRAELDGEGIRSAIGFAFERARASLRGEASVELESSRLVRMVLADEARVAYSRGAASEAPIEQRLRYKDRLVLEPRVGGPAPATWIDGSTRFGPR